jgi:Zn-dependent peptidase ImmA (M78 family)
MENESPLAIVAKYQNPPPTNLILISRELGIRVFETVLEPGVAGKLMRDRTRGGPSGFAIYLNSVDHPNRKRFTYAHEIAHFILHRDLIGDGVIDNALYRSNLPGPVEVQANQLAADILLPVALVKKYRDDNPTLDHMGLAKIFAVSAEVMKIRLQHIKWGKAK